MRGWWSSLRGAGPALWPGALVVALVALAGCGPATVATNTVPPAATGTPPVIGSPAIRGTTTPATAVRPGQATATRGTPAAAGTATRGTPGTVTRVTPGTPGTAASLPAEPGLAFRNLQALDSYRQRWVFGGFSAAGLTGDLAATYAFNGDDIHGILMTGGNTVFEAYQIDGKVYVTNPLGGFLEASPTNPLAAPARAFFDLPRTILTGLTPAGADYRPTGGATVDGRPATRYAGTIEIANLGFIDPSLQGQRGTAATTLTIANDRSILVGTDAEFRTATGGPNPIARARLDVTDIGQVGPISVPR